MTTNIYYDNYIHHIKINRNDFNIINQIIELAANDDNLSNEQYVKIYDFAIRTIKGK